MLQVNILLSVQLLRSGLVNWGWRGWLTWRHKLGAGVGSTLADQAHLHGSHGILRRWHGLARVRSGTEALQVQRVQMP